MENEIKSSFPRQSMSSMHLVFIELEKSGISVAVGDCNFKERRRWPPPKSIRQSTWVRAPRTSA